MKANRSDDITISKWFTYKKNSITGLSKKGIKDINERKITELIFPETIGKNTIDLISDKATSGFCELVPTINTIIIPAGIACQDVIGDKNGISSHTDNKYFGIKKIIFESDEYFNTANIGSEIDHIEIINGSKFATSDGIVFSKTFDELVFYPRGRKSEEYCIPLSVKKIGRDAFCRCEIKNLLIPDSVESLEYGFADCSKIQHLEVPGSVKIIPARAFRGCSHMVELIMHEGIEEIGEEAFSYCGASKVVFPESLCRIKKDAFEHSSSKFEFLSDNVMIYPHAFYKCKTEDTHYSPKIEGKMIRCGYSREDHYDWSKNNTREMALDELNCIAEREINIPETIYFSTITLLVAACSCLKTNDVPDIDLLVKSYYGLKDRSEAYTAAAVIMNNYELFCKLIETNKSSVLVTSICEMEGGKWLKKLQDKKSFGKTS